MGFSGEFLRFSDSVRISDGSFGGRAAEHVVTCRFAGCAERCGDTRKEVGRKAREADIALCRQNGTVG